MPRKFKPAIKSIALVLALSFLLMEVAQAAPFEAAPASQLSPIQMLSQDPTRFEAPMDFTTLREIHKGGSGTFIIHIQDAHVNFSGQQNLANALDEIMTKYKVTLVLVEGGSVEGTLNPIKRLGTPETIRRVAKSFLMEGKISGEEYLNLVSEHPMRIMGIEDYDLYMRSIETYAELAGKRQAILDYLRKIQMALEKVKKKIYPEEIIAYERQKTTGNGSNGQNGNGSFEASFKELLRLAAARELDIKDLPNVQKLIALNEKEKLIDFKLANLEQGILVEEISTRGGGEDLKTYLEKLNKMKGQKVSQFAYFQNTLNIAKENNIDLSKFSNFMRYGEYLKDFTELDLESVLDELSRLEERLYGSLLTAKDQKLTRAIDRFMYLLNAAYNIQMSTKEFNLFKVNEPDFGTVRYLAFINRKLAENGYFEDLIPYTDVLEEGEKSLGAFYDSVTKRDFAFIANTERILKEQNQQVAVLVSGGYHTPHLKKLFKEKAYSYAVLTPMVTTETNQKKYERILLEPVLKEKKVVASVQGEKKADKSLSALEKDLVQLKKKAEGARPLAAVQGARLAELAEAIGGGINTPPQINAALGEINDRVRAEGSRLSGARAAAAAQVMPVLTLTEKRPALTFANPKMFRDLIENSPDLCQGLKFEMYDERTGDLTRSGFIGPVVTDLNGNPIKFTLFLDNTFTGAVQIGWADLTDKRVVLNGSLHSSYTGAWQRFIMKALVDPGAKKDVVESLLKDKSDLMPEIEAGGFDSELKSNEAAEILKIIASGMTNRQDWRYDFLRSIGFIEVEERKAALDLYAKRINFLKKLSGQAVIEEPPLPDFEKLNEFEKKAIWDQLRAPLGMKVIMPKGFQVQRDHLVGLLESTRGNYSLTTGKFKGSDTKNKLEKYLEYLEKFQEDLRNMPRTLPRAPAAAPVEVVARTGARMAAAAVATLPEARVSQRARALGILKTDPNAWVVFSDMMKLGLRNTFYGRQAADIFIMDAERIFQEVVSAYGGFAYRIGEGDDIVTAVLPGDMRPERVESIMEEVQTKIRKSYEGRFGYAKLPDNLTEEEIDNLAGLEEAEGVRSVERLPHLEKDSDGKERDVISPYIFFERKKRESEGVALERILGKAGVRIKAESGTQVQPLEIPYMPGGAVRAGKGDLETLMKEAEIHQRVAKENGLLFGVEGLIEIKKRQMANPILTDDEKTSVNASLGQMKEKLKGYGYPMEDAYAVFEIGPDREELIRIINDVMKDRSGIPKQYIIRAPPDNFYIVRTDGNGDLEVAFIKPDVVLVPTVDKDKDKKVEASFIESRKDARRDGEVGKKFGFKQINDSKYYGHYVGNELIALDNLYLYEAFETEAFETRPDILEALSKARRNINQITGKRGFEVEFNATVVASSDFEGKVDAGQVLNVIDNLSEVRQPVAVTIDVQEEDYPGVNVRRYGKNRNNWPAIQKELRRVLAHKRERAGKELRKAHEKIKILPTTEKLANAFWLARSGKKSSGNAEGDWSLAKRVIQYMNEENKRFNSSEDFQRAVAQIIWKMKEAQIGGAFSIQDQAAQDADWTYAGEVVAQYENVKLLPPIAETGPDVVEPPSAIPGAETIPSAATGTTGARMAVQYDLDTLQVQRLSSASFIFTVTEKATGRIAFIKVNLPSIGLSPDESRKDMAARTRREFTALVETKKLPGLGAIVPAAKMVKIDPAAEEKIRAILEEKLKEIEDEFRPSEPNLEGDLKRILGMNFMDLDSIATEKVEGTNIKAYIASAANATDLEAVRVMKAIVEFLKDRLHKEGVFHRDIKDEIFIRVNKDKDGRAEVTGLTDLLTLVLKGNEQLSIESLKELGILEQSKMNIGANTWTNVSADEIALKGGDMSYKDIRDVLVNFEQLVRKLPSDSILRGRLLTGKGEELKQRLIFIRGFEQFSAGQIPEFSGSKFLTKLLAELTGIESEIILSKSVGPHQAVPPVIVSVDAQPPVTTLEQAEPSKEEEPKKKLGARLAFQLGNISVPLLSGMMRRAQGVLSNLSMSPPDRTIANISNILSNFVNEMIPNFVQSMPSPTEGTILIIITVAAIVIGALSLAFPSLIPWREKPLNDFVKEMGIGATAILDLFGNEIKANEIINITTSPVSPAFPWRSPWGLSVLRLTEKHVIELKGRDPVIFYTKRFLAPNRETIKESADLNKLGDLLEEEKDKQDRAFDAGAATKAKVLRTTAEGPVLFQREAEGDSLKDFLDKYSDPKLREQAFKRIMHALGLLHAAGVVHGDLNNMIARGAHIFIKLNPTEDQVEKITIIDFGLLRDYFPSVAEEEAGAVSDALSSNAPELKNDLLKEYRKGLTERMSTKEEFLTDEDKRRIQEYLTMVTPRIKGDLRLFAIETKDNPKILDGLIKMMDPLSAKAGQLERYLDRLYEEAQSAKIGAAAEQFSLLESDPERRFSPDEWNLLPGNQWGDVARAARKNAYGEYLERHHKLVGYMESGNARPSTRFNAFYGFALWLAETSNDRDAIKFLKDNRDAISDKVLEKNRMSKEKLDRNSADLDRKEKTGGALGGGMNVVLPDGAYVLRRARTLISGDYIARFWLAAKNFMNQYILRRPSNDSRLPADVFARFLLEVEIQKKLNPHGEKSDLPYLQQHVLDDFERIKQLAEKVLKGSANAKEKEEFNKASTKQNTRMVLEHFGEGKNWTEVLQATRLWSERQKLLFLRSILKTQKYMRDKGVVSRDWKPGNIWIPIRLLTVNASGQFDWDEAEIEENPPVVFDFGLARLERSTLSELLDEDQKKKDAVMGTPQYMSPDVIKGPEQNIGDASADLYGALMAWLDGTIGDPLANLKDKIRQEKVPNILSAITGRSIKIDDDELVHAIAPVNVRNTPELLLPKELENAPEDIRSLSMEGVKGSKTVDEMIELVETAIRERPKEPEGLVVKGARLAAEVSPGEAMEEEVELRDLIVVEAKIGKFSMARRGDFVILRDEMGQEWSSDSELVIGRSLDSNLASNVVVTHKDVSRQHARIYKENGEWFVEDLGSTNGTLLDNKNIGKRGKAKLEFYPPIEGPYAIGTEFQDVPDDKMSQGHILVDKLIVPSESKIPKGDSLRKELVRYITKYVKDEEQREIALNNLDNAKLFGYSVEARKNNVLLIFNRPIDLDVPLHAKHIEEVMAAFKSFPQEQLWELGTPVVWQIDESKNVGMGAQAYQATDHTIGAGGAPISFWGERDILEAMIHEVLGHRRHNSWRPKYELRLFEGRWQIKRLRERELVMEGRAWYMVGMVNGVKKLTKLSPELKKNLEKGYTVILDKSGDVAIARLLDLLPKELLNLMRNLWYFWTNYDQHIVEYVAWATHGKRLSSTHNVEKTREILKMSNARGGIPVDPVNDVFSSSLYNPVTREFERYYVQEKTAASGNPLWQEVEYNGTSWEPKGEAIEFGLVEKPQAAPSSLSVIRKSKLIKFSPAVEVVFEFYPDSNKVVAHITYKGKSMPDKEFQVVGGKFTVGREADNTLVLNILLVSRYHALFEGKGDKWNVKDLDSLNGTYIGENEVRLGKNEERDIGLKPLGEPVKGPDEIGGQDVAAISAARLAVQAVEVGQTIRYPLAPQGVQIWITNTKGKIHTLNVKRGEPGYFVTNINNGREVKKTSTMHSLTVGPAKIQVTEEVDKILVTHLDSKNTYKVNVGFPPKEKGPVPLNAPVLVRNLKGPSEEFVASARQEFNLGSGFILAIYEKENRRYAQMILRWKDKNGTGKEHIYFTEQLEKGNAIFIGRMIEGRVAELRESGVDVPDVKSADLRWEQPPALTTFPRLSAVVTFEDGKIVIQGGSETTPVNAAARLAGVVGPYEYEGPRGRQWESFQVSQEDFFKYAPREIQILYRAKEEAERTLKRPIRILLTGGTARDSSVALMARTPMFLSRATDFDVVILGEQEARENDEKAYEAFEEALRPILEEYYKSEEGGSMKPEEAIALATQYALDENPGLYLGPQAGYVYENMMSASDVGEAFTISKLAVERKIDGTFVVFGTPKAIDDLKSGVIRIWTTKNADGTLKIIHPDMTAKMLVKWNVYKDYGFGLNKGESKEAMDALLRSIPKDGGENQTKFIYGLYKYSWTGNKETTLSRVEKLAEVFSLDKQLNINQTQLDEFFQTAAQNYEAVNQKQGARLAEGTKAAPALVAPAKTEEEESLARFMEQLSFADDLDVNPAIFKDLPDADQRLLMMVLINRVLEDAQIPMALKNKEGLEKAVLMIKKDGFTVELRDKDQTRSFIFKAKPDQIEAFRQEAIFARQVVQPVLAERRLPVESITEIWAEYDAKVKEVIDLLNKSWDSLPNTGPLSVSIDLDKLPKGDPEKFKVYAANLLASIYRISKLLPLDARGRVSFRFTISESYQSLLEEMKGQKFFSQLVASGLIQQEFAIDASGKFVDSAGTEVRQAALAGADKVAAMDPSITGNPYLAVEDINPGDLFNFELGLILAIRAGREDPANPTDAFVDALRTQLPPKAGSKLDKIIVSKFLQGITQDMADIAEEFALRALRAVDWMQFLQFVKQQARIATYA